jgi:hypothetical protein
MITDARNAQRSKGSNLQKLARWRFEACGLGGLPNYFR